jgi:hypothetical protein
MKIVTLVSDTNHSGFLLLKASCEYHKLDLVTLVCDQAQYVNHYVKVSLLNKYFTTLDDEELVMFTDGYDTVMLAGMEEILAKFKGFKSEIVFSAETNCYPDASLKSRYPMRSDSPYHFLNSGGFIGKVGFLRKNIAYHVEPNANFDYCDQYFWTRRYLDGRYDITLDSHCELFCTLSPEMGGEGFMSKNMSNYFGYFSNMNDWFDKTFFLAEGRVVSQVTHSKPCNFHFNGKAKCLVSNKTIRNLLIDVYPNFSSEIKNYVSGINNQLFKDDFSKFINDIAYA